MNYFIEYYTKVKTEREMKKDAINYNAIELYLNLMKEVVRREIYSDKFALAMVPGDRIDNIKNLLEIIIKNKANGDIVECGSWRGGIMAYAKSILNIYSENNRAVFLFDTFTGFPCLPNSTYEYERKWCRDRLMNDNSIERVEKSFKKLNLSDGVKFFKGFFNILLKITYSVR